MTRRRLPVLLAAGLLAAPASAVAKGGGADAPAPPPPSSAPCVTATGQGGGTVHGNKAVKPQWSLSNCSSADETVIPHFSNHSYDAWSLGRDCGPDQAWDGSPVAMKAGRAATLNTFAVRGTCAFAQANVITVTFTTPAGGPVSGVGYFGWADALTP